MNPWRTSRILPSLQAIRQTESSTSPIPSGWVILDALKGYTPVIQVIDNAERCHKLGIVSEFSVGNGSLLVCMTGLDAIAATPEGSAFRTSLLRYIASPDFRPSYRLTFSGLLHLLYGARESSDIHGVENQTDYSKFAE